MFQANCSIRIEFSRKVEGRTCCELEVVDDGVRTDSVEDIRERLRCKGRDGEVDGGCEEGEKEGGCSRMVCARGI